MLENLDMSLVDWSRAQFALTAIYHWFFVPLTLGLAFLVAIMESVYVKTGDQRWKKLTKFWMTLFGINFAIGVATGIILEFEFGTNWSKYSWFVGDIFGAPLAVEGILAFFMESTFIAVMFFGWNKVSKKFHLISTWLVAVGANLSALWILVANAWMQSPVGMQFNPETARNEMLNFWQVLFSPVAVNKFLHTISNGFVLASIFVIGVSAWFLIKNREKWFAKRSILVAGVFGLITSVYLVFTGDSSTRQIVHVQPMKFAALEGLYRGQKEAGLVALGIMSNTSSDPDDENIKDFHFTIEIPNLLSYMAYGEWDAFVPGVNDLVNGNPEQGIMSGAEKIRRGKIAIADLRAMKEAKLSNDDVGYVLEREKFYNKEYKEEYMKYFGYGFLNDPNSLIPNVPLTFYSFHTMVGLGFYFIFFFILALVYLFRKTIEQRKWFLRLALFTIPLPYIASQAGWIVAEVGRQPWVIQDLMPTVAATSNIDASAVQVTFWLFAAIFTVLAIAEVSIMTKQIKIGPKEEGEK
ncbi:MAG: cytochrome ubiquinol oxidase subunit I [Bacteroidales bacterium]|nr:cytochrome ubiquinol oxidase subunit I [Bacteroidales bacterium]MCB8999697.1 cytochrome ubiquinol oxidase subunit I [Bacteroidales bacterium]